MIKASRKWAHHEHVKAAPSVLKHNNSSSQTPDSARDGAASAAKSPPKSPGGSTIRRVGSDSRLEGLARTTR